MLNEEFLRGPLGNEDASADDKVRQIVAEYNADIIGLKKKNEELLGKEAKFKEQIASFEAGKPSRTRRSRALRARLRRHQPTERATRTTTTVSSGFLRRSTRRRCRKLPASATSTSRAT